MGGYSRSGGLVLVVAEDLGEEGGLGDAGLSAFLILVLEGLDVVIFLSAQSIMHPDFASMSNPKYPS